MKVSWQINHHNTVNCEHDRSISVNGWVLGIREYVNMWGVFEGALYFVHLRFLSSSDGNIKGSDRCFLSITP